MLGTLTFLFLQAADADAGARLFRPADVFDLEYASDPEVAPDGQHVVYVRNSMDVMTDRRRSNLWMVDFHGADHRPLTTGNANDASPRWSPDGTRLAYVSTVDGSAQLYVRWMDTGQTAKVTNLTESPQGLVWSPDGRWLAFAMRVPETREPMAKMPPKPEGATWAEPPKVIEKLLYRADGGGYLEDGFEQVFVVPADGGAPRQVTRGPFPHGGELAWSPDGKTLYLSANEDWEHQPRDSEIYAVDVASGAATRLTDRRGPDSSPTVSPDGGRIAYLGFDDRYQGYQVTRLCVMQSDGSDPRVLTAGFDRDVESPVWAADGSGLFAQVDDEGDSRIVFFPLEGEPRVVAEDLGGESLGRPYSGGSFSVSPTGRYAYTYTTPERPADVAFGGNGEQSVVTRLNEDLLGHKELARVEQIRFASSHDGREIQGWIAKPPGFEAGRKYPLVLEIHGGPFANYGERFAAEVQLYAAAGYVVLYTNPRGSTSYGEEFGNLIHHAYPGNDYDDLMSGVDAVIARGFVDPEQLFVTGGSGGGVLTAWIVGKTDRFRAAVVAKPVINWTSFALTADMYNFFWRYWFPGYPWDEPQAYFERSPLSLVGNVVTPTMLLTGELDYRTPIAESEQLYQALKLRGVDAAMVRIPGAGHGIAARPSQLIAKVAHVLAWFERYGDGAD